MKVKNRYVVIAGISLVIVLIIAGSYLIMNPPTGEGSETYEDEQSNDSSKTIQQYNTTITSNLNDLQRNSKPQFKVGERYKYKFDVVPNEFFTKVYRGESLPGMDVYSKTSSTANFTVESKERINGSGYYVINAIQKGYVIAVAKDKTGMMLPMRSPDDERKFYVDTESGYIKTKISGNDQLTSVEEGGVGAYMEVSMFYVWMLSLTENSKWFVKIEESSDDEEFILEREYTTLKGIEKVGGRDCFRVEKRTKACKNQKCDIKNRATYWVDVNKRILVKEQIWYENLLVSEVVLTDIL